MDAAKAEARYTSENVSHVTPESLYEQKWAEEVISEALRQLRIEMAAKKNPGVFECVQEVIFDGTSMVRYEEHAAKLGMQVGALQTAISRARRRLKVLVREEVGRTLSLRTESEIDDEMRHLLRVTTANINSAAWSA